MNNRLHDNSITSREAVDTNMMMQEQNQVLAHLGPMSKRD